MLKMFICPLLWLFAHLSLIRKITHINQTTAFNVNYYVFISTKLNNNSIIKAIVNHFYLSCKWWTQKHPRNLFVKHSPVVSVWKEAVIIQRVQNVVISVSLFSTVLSLFVIYYLSRLVSHLFMEKQSDGWR